MVRWVGPNQARGLQGQLCGSSVALAAKEVDTGTGWQQNMQTQPPRAVEGTLARTTWGSSAQGKL